MDLSEHQEMTGQIAQLVDELKQLAEYYPSKQLSVAITHIETGLLWFRDIKVEVNNDAV